MIRFVLTCLEGKLEGTFALGFYTKTTVTRNAGQGHGYKRGYVKADLLFGTLHVQHGP
jgi:hypothetical protein